MIEVEAEAKSQWLPAEDYVRNAMAGSTPDEKWAIIRVQLADPVMKLNPTRNADISKGLIALQKEQMFYRVKAPYTWVIPNQTPEEHAAHELAAATATVKLLLSFT